MPAFSAADANDELEAILAIYGDDVALISDLTEIKTALQPWNPFAALTMHFTPRTAGDIRNTFVTAQIQFAMAADYPLSKPVVRIMQTSGLGDDGRQLITSVQNMICTLSSGDPMLTLLISHVLDLLDDANTGECLICNGALEIVDSTNTNSSSRLSFRTNCYHCYHIDCLCKWGAIVHCNALRSKEAVSRREKDELRVRSAEGEMKSVEESVRASMLEADMIRSAIEDIHTEMKADEDSSTSAAVSRVTNDRKPKAKGKGSDKHNSVSVEPIIQKRSKEPKGSSETDRIDRDRSAAKMTAEELQEVAELTRQRDIRLAQLEASLIDAEKKRERLEKKFVR